MWPRNGLVCAVVALAWGCSQGHPTAVPTRLSSVSAPSGWPSWEGASVVAHRGFACCYPENTLESIEAAIALGAKSVEVDVRLTQDWIPVLLHDETLDRTTNQTGLIGDRTFTQLDAVNACPQNATPCRIPSLREALALAQGRTRVVLDLKDAMTLRAVHRILEDVSATTMDTDVAVISGRLDTLRLVRMERATIPIGFYVVRPKRAAASRAGMPRAIEDLLDLGYAEIFLHVEEIDERGALYQAAISGGLPIGVWTIHTRGQVASMLGTPGVTRVLSDVVP